MMRGRFGAFKMKLLAINQDELRLFEAGVRLGVSHG